MRPGTLPLTPRGGGPVGKVSVQAIPGAGLSKSDFRLRAAYSLNFGLNTTGSEPPNASVEQFTLETPFGISGVQNPSGVIPMLEGVTWGINDIHLKDVYTPKTINIFDYNLSGGNTNLCTFIDSDTKFPYDTVLTSRGPSNNYYAKVTSIDLVRITSGGQPVISVVGKFWRTGSENVSSAGRCEIRIVLEFGLN